MIPFRNLTLADKPLIERYVCESGRVSSDVLFGNLWAERHQANVRFAVVEGMLVLRFETNGRFTYSMPLGRGNLRFALMQMMEDADTMRMACGLTGLTEDDVAAVKTAMPGYYAFEAEEGGEVSTTYSATPLTNYTNSIFYNNEGMVPPP